MAGLLRGVARTAVVAGTATSVSNRVSRRQAGRWAAQAHPSMGHAQPPAPPPAAPAPAPPPAAPATVAEMDAKIEQLKQLGALWEQGILSREELEAQKARVLGG